MWFYKVKLADEESKIAVVRDKILDLLGGKESGGKTIVYVRMCRSAIALRNALEEHGYAVTITEGFRRIIQQEFNTAQVVISPDLFTPPFDHSQVNLVINYDLPVIHEYYHDIEADIELYLNNPMELFSSKEPDNQEYLKRIGRGQLFGGKGVVFNLLCGDRDDMIMQQIERHFNLYNFTEVPSTSDEDFRHVLEEAGLMM